MKSLHIRYLFVSSLTADLPAWSAALNASQFLPALVLPCDGGRARIAARREADDIDALTDLSRKVGAEHDPLGKTGLHQLAQITKIADSGQSLERGDVYMYVGVAVQESQQ